MLSTYLIALREGLEASLIIGILVAYLQRSNRGKSLPYLWLGVAIAISSSLIFGAFLSFTSTQLSRRGEEIFAGTTSVAAVIFVTFMVFWMKRSARFMADDLRNKIDVALPLGKIALVSAAFFAVAREGLETALFVFSNFKTVSKDSAPALGLSMGLASAIGLGVAIYRRSLKLNLGKFFTVTGSALLVVAAGVLSHAISEFQNFGALPGSSSLAWNWQGANNALSTILDGTIGIGTSITWLQLLVWALYLGVVLQRYLAPKVLTELTPTR
ncbi:MAG: iron transporter [Actinomycetales bacterium]|nr:MAG: iron transporter [Actinomycetales bacterium]